MESTPQVAVASVPYTTLENLYGETNVILDEFFPDQCYINFGYSLQVPSDPDCYLNLS